jgi:YggT family protein
LKDVFLSYSCYANLYLYQEDIAMLIAIVKTLFSVYTLMLLIKVLSSWFPQYRNHPFLRFVSQFTDPYLNFFRKFIPPLGGTIDLSPLVAFIALQIVETFLLRIL